MYRVVTAFFPATRAAFAGVLVMFLVGPLLTAGSASGAGALTLVNPRFEHGTTGWSALRADTRLSITSHGRGGTDALRIASRRVAPAGAYATRRVTDGSAAGTAYIWRAWMRGNRSGMRARMRVDEYHDGRIVQTRRTTVSLDAGTWRALRVPITRQRAGSRFAVRVINPWSRTRDVLVVDDVLAAKTWLATTGPQAVGAGPTLSNGCGTTRRGIPLCGAYLGSAYGSNSEPTPFETDMKRRLGVRRTYFTGSQVGSAVAVADADLAAGRLPWISFKLPYSWSDMAAGRGDAWTRDLAARLSRLPGPVWVAFHHEPEGDGDIQTWRAMQERLAPIVRSTAPNVAYTVILTGWHQLFGDAQYSLDATFPRVTVDVAGFDVYNQYGVVKNGVTNTKGTNLREWYFEPISRWAAQRGVAWGIAETGFSDSAGEVQPHWVDETYTALDQLDGVAFTYFNTTLNSSTNWALTTISKRASYREAAVDSPVLPRLP